MAELITADNVYTTIAPLNGKYFKLEELYSLLSCRMVQILELPGQPHQTLIFDEEGKTGMDGPKPINRAATLHARTCGIASNDCIVGTALLCLSREFR